MRNAIRSFPGIILTIALMAGRSDATVTGTLPLPLPSSITLDLPHVPDDAPTRMIVAGRTAANGEYADVWHSEVTSTESAGTVTVRISDPQVHDRYLYAATITCAPEAEDVAERRWGMTLGLDGVQMLAADAPQQWDTVGRVEETLADAPASDMVVASVALNDSAGPIAGGTRGLSATLTISNQGDEPARILHTSLVPQVNGSRRLAAFSSFPSSSRPRLLPPGESVQQTFRVDTFDDTPVGDLWMVPVVIYVDAAADLLRNADPGEPGGEDALWTAPEDGGEFDATAISNDALAAFADRVADWQDYSEVTFSPPAGVGVSGESYAPLALPQAMEAVVPVQETAPIPLPDAEGSDLAFGCASWGGERVRLELLDEAGGTISAVERNFTGFWWRDSVYNWTERVLTIPLPEGAASARIALIGRNKTTWWDDCYLVPRNAVRRATGEPLTLNVAAPSSTDRSIVHLGEDRETQGNWIGNYGSYCWILSAMSAPRDMVGGQVEPIKCKHFDFDANYKNEVIRVRGEGEFRYAGWTSNPKDALTRHWVGAMRSYEARALENPQWGERTYASWDDHGELHPTDWWGPDLLVRLRIPDGLWKVSFYFLDWDWHAAPFPRDHRIELGGPDEAPECFARVTDAGQGVYKAFAVRGGRDIVVRIRKDQSAAVLASGVFLDPLAAPELHPLGAKIPEDLRETLKRLDTLDADDIAAQVAVPELARQVDDIATAGPDVLADPATQRLRVELWRRTVGHVREQQEAFDAYVAAVEQSPEPERVVEHLLREAEDYFDEGALGPAELRHDAALEIMRGFSDATEMASAHRDAALRFRVEHPLYAQRQIASCLEAVADRPREDQVTYARALADELFTVASADYKEGRGLVRLPYALAEYAYRRLVDLVGYDGLTADERMKLMLAVERQTWYTLGWERLAAEQERLIESIPEDEVTGELLTHLIRSYAVLAQSDASYIEKAAEVAERLKTELPDGDWTLDAYFRMAQIYYHKRQNEKAREACRKVIELAPGTPEAGSAERMIEQMEKGRKTMSGMWRVVVTVVAMMAVAVAPAAAGKTWDAGASIDGDLDDNDIEVPASSEDGDSTGTIG